MASYVLWEVKNHVPTCGGDSIIYSLSNNKELSYQDDAFIRDCERHFSQFDRLIQEVRLRAADLSLSEGDFSEIMNKFVVNMKLLRNLRLVTLEEEEKIGVIVISKNPPEEQGKNE